MTGLLISEEFVAVFPSLVRALGNMEAAAILQRLHFKADDGVVRMSAQTLSEDTGIAVRTVQRRLKDLRENGILSSERAGTYDATAVWTINYDHPVLSGGDRQIVEWDRTGEVDTAKVAVSEDDKVAVSSSSKNIKNTHTPETHTLGSAEGSVSSLSLSALDADFEEWYQRYPKHRGKGAARASYVRARRKKGVSKETLLVALAAQLPELRAKEQRFVKDPSTWLNQECWEDEPTGEPKTVFDLEREYQ